MLIGRFIAIATLVTGAAVTSQLPEFAQQYRQRLGGAVDELRTVVARFDSDAASEGLDRAQALDRHRTNADDLFRKRGEAMQDTIARFDRLQRQQSDMAEDNTLVRVTSLAMRADRDLAHATLEAYEPAMPLTPEGGVFATLGAFLAWLVLRIVTWPKRALDRQIAYRRAYRR